MNESLVKAERPQVSSIPDAHELVVSLPIRTLDFIYAWGDFQDYSLNALVDWAVEVLDERNTVMAAYVCHGEDDVMASRWAAKMVDAGAQSFTIEGKTAEKLQRIAKVTGWKFGQIVDRAIDEYVTISPYRTRPC